MKAVFLDTVGLIAIWDVRDQWHLLAVPVFDDLAAKDIRLITTPYVLMECANTAARKKYRTLVYALRETLGIAGDLYDPTPDELQQAWQDYQTGPIGSAGVVDRISFAVMKRLGITDAFSNDRHFHAAGFTPLF